jgi:ActR/RegA family two-component response regulator
MPDLADQDLQRRVDEALAAHHGNVAAAARALGLHRNQLRRLLAARKPSQV